MEEVILEDDGTGACRPHKWMKEIRLKAERRRLFTTRTQHLAEDIGSDYLRIEAPEWVDDVIELCAWQLFDSDLSFWDMDFIETVSQAVLATDRYWYAQRVDQLLVALEAIHRSVGYCEMPNRGGATVAEFIDAVVAKDGQLSRKCDQIVASVRAEASSLLEAVHIVDKEFRKIVKETPLPSPAYLGTSY